VPAAPRQSSSHIVVAGNPRTNRLGRYGAVKGAECLEDTAAAGSVTNRFGNALGVTCCDADGLGSRPGCRSAATFVEAEAHCAALGLGLCSLEQVEGGAGAQTGCSFDHYAVRTADLCSRPAGCADPLAANYGSVEDATCLYLGGRGVVRQSWAALAPAARDKHAAQNAAGWALRSTATEKECPWPGSEAGWAAAVTGAALADSVRYRVGPAGANACNPGDARIATEAECALATRYVLDVSLAPPYSFHTFC
jgi:hypothetical protein